jgi:hypothetical protein
MTEGGNFNIKDINVLNNLLAGASARVCAATIMFPIDSVKTRMQFQRENLLNHKIYKNGWDCLKSIIKDEGIFSLYKGILLLK